ncbi:hypothetical protein K6716_12860, partial [Escherichia marmotae]|nr:hypothetical protein [Escherichia marmotae]
FIPKSIFRKRILYSPRIFLDTFPIKEAEKHSLSKITLINKQTNIQKTLQFQITHQKKKST